MIRRLGAIALSCVFLARSAAAVMEYPITAPQNLETQSDFHAVFDGRQIGMIWSEAGKALFGRALADGTLLDGAGIPLGRGIAGALGTNGEDFVAIWSDADIHEVVAARISSRGEILDFTPIQLPFSPEIVLSDGRDFLLAGIGVSSNPLNIAYILMTAVLTSRGVLADNPNPLYLTSYGSTIVGQLHGTFWADQYVLSWATLPVPVGGRDGFADFVVFDKNGQRRQRPDIRPPAATTLGITAVADSLLIATHGRVPSMAPIVVTSWDPAGNLLGMATIEGRSLQALVAADGFSWLFYDWKALRIDSAGHQVGDSIAALPTDVLLADIETAGPALVAFFGRQTASNGTTVTRYYFTVLLPPRARAVRH